MMKQSKFVVVAGRQATGGVVGGMQAGAEVREATTGRVVVVQRMWATADSAAKVGSGRLSAGATDQAVLRQVRRKDQAELEEELGFYRKYTEGLLRRYVQLTMEAGRVSSLMGREVLRGKASSYRIHGFDDAVIFRLDVEKCLKRLDKEDHEVIRRVGIQEYTHLEAAELLGVSLRTLGTRYSRAMNKLTRILLETRLLEPLKGCQVLRG